jgi:DNA-binding transcriptional MerR regulator
MSNEIDTLVSGIIDQLSSLAHIRPTDIPNIDLYMDQVTSFMDDHLQETRRHEKDKILTKTMINNYAKNKLLPPPEKKRYSKEHMLVLIFIYYMKGFMSLDDIRSILTPVTERFFRSDEDINIEDIYSEVYSLGKEHIASIQEEVRETYRKAASAFPEANESDREFLQTFSFICLLCFDIYLRKQIIEKLIDSWRTDKEL